jgi:hypothetical protein
MVNIDTVYQRVLALANKEQRGYITPLEYNLMANQAQLAVFEQYFYDLDQAKRKPSDSTTFSDMTELIKSKLAPFTTIQAVLSGASVYPLNYRIGKIYAHNYEVKLVSLNDVRNLLDSPFHRTALAKNPVYIEARNPNQDIRVYDGLGPTGRMTGGVSCEVITMPGKVEWGYDVVGEKALYNGALTRTTHFAHHESDETELVLKVLEMAGVIIQDPGLIQYADSEEMKKVQQEKI